MSTTTTPAAPVTPKYTKKDFTSDREVKWCPGCGDYAILAALQKAMADLGRPKEKQLVVSGIGCSSRLPVYVDTHGFHTIHGRAPTIATGAKIANPDLDIWLITGDGDALSIGGNHILHAIRRNVNMVVLLFNNKIYGLTKGQYSPTSEVNKVTKSTPYGSVDAPLNPLAFALACGATFVARTFDTNPKHMGEVFRAAREHKGLAFVEIFQNCVIFNDGAYDNIYAPDVRAERMVELVNGQPLLFGKDKSQAVVLEGLSLKTMPVAEAGDRALVHRTDAPVAYAQLLAGMTWPDFPVPIGILHQEARPTFDDAVNAQVAAVTAKQGSGDLHKLLLGEDHWQIH